ncbi:hypothetical protein HPB47_014815 [Ixodes persulcatus]|uniref:Uncharacterized protein n=1 Tax=Ixodes persulcatus TaxID=34615 RepID=A0AC60QV27_IXOPE|nr:hypothetical protein HPB47_014815 [Ixodes persulcatus]
MGVSEAFWSEASGSDESAKWATFAALVILTMWPWELGLSGPRRAALPDLQCPVVLPLLVLGLVLQGITVDGTSYLETVSSLEPNLRRTIWRMQSAWCRRRAGRSRQGRQKPLGECCALQRTFSQVLQQNPATSSRSPAGQQQEGALLVAPLPTTPPPPAAPRESLLVYPASKPAAGVEPFEGISHLLRTTFKPAELRLGLDQIKPVRGGAIVLGHSAAALDRLAEAIKANEETASQLTTRQSEKRAPQVKIVGI